MASMQLSISPNFWVFNFLKNAEERDLKIADYLDSTADEATNLARVWENVAETVLATNVADASSNSSWSRLIERPEWTIYSKNIPKSRLEMFFERVSKVMGKGQRGSMDYLICKMGSILQKRRLTKEIIEEEFKLIKSPKFFDKNNRMHEDVNITESISLMNSEAEALTSFSREFRSNLLKARLKPVREVVKPVETIKPERKRTYLFSNLTKFLLLKIQLFG